MRTSSLLIAAACGAAPALLAAQQPGRLNLDSLRRAVVTIHALDSDGESIASGTGFFVFYNGGEGLVVTAAHVLEGAAGCSVELTNGEKRRCSATASDTAKDVIMLLVPGSPPGTLKWGWSDRAQDGDEVTVISNPLGELPGTVSKGIISASRVVNGTKLLQISAPISHGSSGAPVLNGQGQVIGVVRSTIESGQSLNFATATDVVRNMQMDPGALAEARGMMHGAPAASRPASSSPSSSSTSYDGRPITIGQAVTGTLTTGDNLYGDSTYFQRWQFKPAAGGQDVTIDLTSPDFRPALILHGLDTSVVNLNGGPSCAARISLNFPGPGPYEILVNTSSTPTHQTGRFTLALSTGIKPVIRRTGHCPPGGNGSMHTIAVGQTVSGELTNSDDLYADTTLYQRWRFTAQPGQDLTVDLSSSDFDPELLFYGLDTVIVNDDGGPGCASRVAFTAPTSGPYVLLVNTTNNPHRQTGRFTLSVSPGKKPVDPPDTRDCQTRNGSASSSSGQTAPDVGASHGIAIGQSVSGRVSSSDEMWVDSTYIQRWKVNGQPGQTVTIDLQSSDFDAYMMVKGPGVPSDHDSDDDSGGKCNARLVVTFTQAAPYEIDVNTQGRKYATGAFVLSVTSGAKPKSDTPCHPG